VRPPGHHAGADDSEGHRAEGFCFYNSAAVAARCALETNRARRVAIIDWDIHHGNGTQAILYDDPRVLYISLHRCVLSPPCKQRNRPHIHAARRNRRLGHFTTATARRPFCTTTRASFTYRSIGASNTCGRVQPPPPTCIVLGTQPCRGCGLLWGTRPRLSRPGPTPTLSDQLPLRVCVCALCVSTVCVNRETGHTHTRTARRNHRLGHSTHQRHSGF